MGKDFVTRNEINFPCSSLTLSPFYSVAYAVLMLWYYDQLPICSSVWMACGRRQPTWLVTLTVLVCLQSWWTP